MDPVTISFTFPGFKNLWNYKFTEAPPETTGNMIVFRLNSFSKKFSRETYSPEMTDGKVSSQEVNQALAVFEIAMSRAVSSFDLIKNLFIRFLLPYLLIEFFDMCYFIRGRLMWIIWLFFVAYCAAGISYLLMEGNEKIERSRAEMKCVIELIQPGYLAKGLRWRIPEGSFGWVELIKENGFAKGQASAQVAEVSFSKAAETKGNPEPVVQEGEGKTGIDDSLFSCIRDS